MRGAETIVLADDSLERVARDLLATGGRMQMAYGCTGENGGIELRYLVSPPGAETFVVWRCRPAGDPPSLASIWPLLGWYEREIMDLHGIRFANHPEPNRLVLGEGVPPPLARNGCAPPRPTATAEDVARAMPEISGGDVQILPFGPVRADVLESAEFSFLYIGEQILHYHPHLFLKHRGMEKRFEGIDPRQGVILAERVSGVGSIAHALAFCQAVEAACGCDVPRRACWLRVLIAELERVYSHLHACSSIASRPPASPRREGRRGHP